MTTPSTMDRIIVDLKEKLAEARIEAKEVSSVAMNSYGAGFKAGKVEAYRELLEEITGDTH